MKANNIILVSETHWDREWYLTFQEFRVRLIKMMESVIEILNHDSRYKSFTLDGQTILIEDYLEIKPDEEFKLKNLIQERRLLVGPMYVMPDEFLVSGESLIRNLMIGHKIARRFGSVMKVGYSPDPFGHIAQLPQILQGFEIPAVLFWRGLGNQFSKKGLNIEFFWKAPGNAASVLASVMKLSYGSVANLSTKKKNGVYKKALQKLNWAISKLENFTATPVILLNSGTDHSFANPVLPEIVDQWNELNPEKCMELGNFEEYVNKVMASKPNLQSYKGELRGSKYIHLLSGVLSTRMWVKQLNSRIEHLYEKYIEPLSTITWVVNNHRNLKYPSEFILNGYKWLLKNHPHDSICGCSIDQVYEEMKIRYLWAEQMGLEVLKNSLLTLDEVIHIQEDAVDRIHLVVYNPLPWKRRDVVQFNILTDMKRVGIKAAKNFNLCDYNDKEIEYQIKEINEVPRFRHVNSKSYKCEFIGEIPACGFSIYYLKPNNTSSLQDQQHTNIISTNNMIENQYYKITAADNGEVTLFDKESQVWYKNIYQVDDIGDWGDLYDFSGPRKGQSDTVFSTKNNLPLNVSTQIYGSISKSLLIEYDFKLPISLSSDRKKREEILVSNPISITLTVYESIRRVDININVENKSRDHKLRIKFPTSIKTEEIKSDGHFHVISRPVDIPEGSDWNQKPTTTNYNEQFVAVSDNNRTHAILNKGLPEYDATKNDDGTVTLGITLLRCVEWLSRFDLNSRDINAGPDLNTPEAQCIGSHLFELSLIIENNNHGLENLHRYGQEFSNPLMAFCPAMINTNMGANDRIILAPLGILYPYRLKKHVERKSFLPAQFSFLSIDNKSIALSILKKAEEGDDMIIRLYNLSAQPQIGKLSFWDDLQIMSAKIVNLLEEHPINKIKANVKLIEKNNIDLSLDPHVIATVKVNFKCKFEKNTIS